MDANGIIGQIERDGARLIEVAARALDAAVPTCGDWRMRDLVGHMGWVHGLVASYIAKRASEPLGREDMPKPPKDDSVCDFAAGELGRLVEALSGVDPADTSVWNWSPRPDAGFYFRRMRHETSIHRWDAENALGDTTDVDGDDGADGVDEFFEFVVPNALKRKARELPTASLHLHRTDGDGEWIVHAEDGSIVMERAHVKGDAALRGPGGALFLAVWSRLPLDDPSLSVIGEEDAARAWMSLAP